MEKRPLEKRGRTAKRGKSQVQSTVLGHTPKKNMDATEAEKCISKCSVKGTTHNIKGAQETFFGENDKKKGIGYLDQGGESVAFNKSQTFKGCTFREAKMQKQTGKRIGEKRVAVMKIQRGGREE